MELTPRSKNFFFKFLQKSFLDFSRNLFLISPEIFSRFLEKSVLDFSRNLFLVSANICLCSDERVLSAVHSLASYNTAFWPLFCIEHLHHIYEAGRGLRSWQWGVLSTYVEQCLTVNWFKIILSQQSALQYPATH